MIWDLPSLDPSVSRDIGSMIVSNIGDLVKKKRAGLLEAENL